MKVIVRLSAQPLQWFRRQYPDIAKHAVITRTLRDAMQMIEPGDVFVGMLSVGLAAKVCEMGAVYVHVTFDLPPQMRLRSHKLSALTLEKLGGRLRKYDVRRKEDAETDASPDPGGEG